MFRNRTTSTGIENWLVSNDRVASETSISAIKFDLNAFAKLGKITVPN